MTNIRIVVINIFLVLFLNAAFIENTFSSELYQRGLDKKMVTIDGFIADEPRLYNGDGGKYQSYAFRVNAASAYKHGDEFISVTVHTVKWGKKVGDFNGKKGDRVSLTGKYSEFKASNRKTGIVGSLSVNDKSIKEVKP